MNKSFASEIEQEIKEPKTLHLFLLCEYSYKYSFERDDNILKECTHAISV